jgi:hypothetical protein
LPVSGFDPVLVETSLDLVLLRPRASAVGLGLTMHEPIGRGRLFSLLPLGSLARGSEVDDFAHSRSSAVTRYVIEGPSLVGFIWNKYADTEALDHAAREPM